MFVKFDVKLSLSHKPLKYTNLSISTNPDPKTGINNNNNNNNNNIAEYLNTNYNMNSIIKTAAKITKELSEPNEK